VYDVIQYSIFSTGRYPPDYFSLLYNFTFVKVKVLTIFTTSRPYYYHENTFYS